MYYGQFAPYVPVWKRREQAQRKIAQMKKRGRQVNPVVIEGRAIATTFWGKAWCENLESYSDFANRLPRGRTYARNGSVIDLQIETGKVTAMVSGSSIYDVRVEVTPLAKKRWAALVRECAGKIDSVVELLAGKLSGGVMEILCRKGTGLFPSTKEVSFSCSCPDGAWLCKHLAAVLYGVGARLDHEPELLFLLRGVEKTELAGEASRGGTIGQASRIANRLDGESLADVFGIEMDSGGAEHAAAPRKIARAAGRSRASPRGRGGQPAKNKRRRAKR